MAIRISEVRFAGRARLLALDRSCALGAMAIASLALPQLAYAQNECGAPVTPTVTCTAANDPYATGVTYIAPPIDLTIVLDDDTVVDTSGGAHPGLQAVATANRSLTLQAAPGSKITTDAVGAHGVSLTTDSGAINATTGAIRTSGADAVGALARSNSGNVTLTVGSIRTAGTDAVGAIVRTGGTGAATVQGGTISTTGANAVGVSVKSATGRATVNLTSVTTSGAGADGIRATSSGGVAAVTVGTVVTSGADARGIVVTGAQGAVVNYGTITTTGDRATGISIPVGVPVVGPIASSTASVTGTGSISTTGARADGINAAATGAVTVSTTGTVSTMGTRSRGIVARGGGAVTVTAAGVTTLGTTSTAVGAISSGGSASVTLSGVTSSKMSDGVAIVAATSASLTLVAGSSLNGGANGATIISGTGATVNNAGTLDGTGYALVVNGGAANVTNSGTLNGRIALSDNADVVNNSGLFNATAVSLYGAGNDQFNNSGTYLANADADFGAGTDLFTNMGVFRVLGASATPGTVTLAGLEAYGNSGLVDLRNGHVGDVLVLPGTYSGSGGATLGLDVTPGAAGVNTDQLRIGGAASGSTQVALTIVGNGQPVFGNAAVLVQAGAASSANAFTIAGGNVDQGLIQYGIVYNPASFTYNLVGAPGAGVYRAAVFGEAVHNLWLQSGDAWTGHMRALRDTIPASGPRRRIWAQTLGQVEQRTNSRTFTSFGITSQVDLGYKQDYFGGQMGVDFGGGGFVFGVTGGYLNSNLNFAHSADRMNFDAVNGGVYAGYSAGGFFLNALAKYDHYWGSNPSLTGGTSRDIQGSVYGGKAEIGYRFGKQVFLEPAASISYSHDDMDDVTVVAGSFAFHGDDGVRGKAGARIGYVAELAATTLSLYGGGNYVHAFQGENKVSFTSGGQSVSFANGRIRDYGELTLGLKIGSDQDKISGFIEGRYASGGDYEGYGGLAGGHVRF